MADIFSDTDARRRTEWVPAFEYPNRWYAAAVSIVLLASALWVALTGNGGAVVALMLVLPVAIQVAAVVATPRRFTIHGNQLEAQYFGGRTRTWPIADLQPGQSTLAALSGATAIVNSTGTTQFWLWSDLEDREQLMKELGRI